MTNLLDVSRQLLDLLLEHKIPTADTLTSVLDLAEANDLLLAAASALDHVPHAYRKRYDECRQLEENTWIVFRDVLDWCTGVGLPLLTIKSFLPFPYVDSNIDIVAVNPSRLTEYQRGLGHLGFVRLRNLADVREPNKEMYRNPLHREGYPKLHLHRAIAWNGVVYLGRNQVWERHRLEDIKGILIPIPSPEDQVLVLAAHAVFENKYITLNELLHCYWLCSRSLDWNYVYHAAAQHSWLEALRLFLATTTALGDSLGIQIHTQQSLSSRERLSSVSFPFVLPVSKTFKATWSKLWLDVRRGQFEEVPRQLVAYSLVDCLWMYRKARRKARVGRS